MRVLPLFWRHRSSSCWSSPWVLPTQESAMRFPSTPFWPFLQDSPGKWLSPLTRSRRRLLLRRHLLRLPYPRCPLCARGSTSTKSQEVQKTDIFTSATKELIFGSAARNSPPTINRVLEPAGEVPLIAYGLF